MKNYILIFTLFLSLAACKKDKIVDPVPTVPTTMEDLVVASNFDWKTTRDIELTVTGDINNIFIISTVDGIPYHSAFLTANVPYTVRFAVPAYEKTIQLSYKGKNVTIELGNGVLSYQF